ncbi:hypothetical protein ABZV34_37550 [Streptomyces sp. NPDC005195]|uniref:hypothetical protein n=1 Tax=Streptomyces sp. NPDC005195 TaxID=3154561 RepID=UPI0033B56374
MIVEAEPSSPPSRWFRGIGFGVFFGGLTAVVTIAAIGRAWAACDIGSSAGANGMTLVVLAPLIWIAATVPWVILHNTLGRRHRRTALMAGFIFTLWFIWFLVTWLGMPDSYPAPFCPGNVPPLVAELHPGMTPAWLVNDLGAGSGTPSAAPARSCYELLRDRIHCKKNRVPLFWRIS